MAPSKRDWRDWAQIVIMEVAFITALWYTVVILRAGIHSPRVLVPVFIGLLLTAFGFYHAVRPIRRLNELFDASPRIPLAKVIVSGPEHNPRFRYADEDRPRPRLPLTTERYEDDDI